MLVRVAVASLLALSSCHPEPTDSSSSTDPEKNAESVPDLTVETLGGQLYAPANADVTWARTFAGELDSPPEIKVGPGDELIAQVAIPRRPKQRFVSDVWLMRLEGATGDVSWLQKLDGYARFEPDSQGNIVLAWPTRLQKRRPDGSSLWSKELELTNAYPHVALAVDNRDNILVLKQDLDSPTPNSSDDARGLLELSKLDPSGNSLWSHAFGGGDIQYDGAYVAADGAGNVLVLASRVASEVDFGGGGLSGAAVLAKYDAQGEHVFSKSLGLGGPITIPVRAPLLLDTDGNIFVTSPSFGEIDVGLGPIFCPGDYVIKLDPTGALLWNDCAVAGEVSVLADGGYITSATLGRTQKVGEDECTVLGEQAEGSEGVLARYDAEGAWLKTACRADEGYQAFGRAVGDSSGAVLMSAAFTRQLTLPDGKALAPVDDWTALIAKVGF